MTQNDPMAGTTPQGADGNTETTGNGAEPTSPAPTPEDRLARLEAELEAAKAREAQHLAEKTNREQERRELEDLRARNANRPVSEPVNPWQQYQAQLQQDMLRAAEIASDPNDPYAAANRLALTAVQMQGEIARQNAERDQREANERAIRASLKTVPAEWREKTEDFYNKNREHFSLPEHAFNALRGIEAGTVAADKSNSDEAQRRRDAVPRLPSAISDGQQSAGGKVTMRRADYYAAVAAGRTDLIDKKDMEQLILTD